MTLSRLAAGFAIGCLCIYAQAPEFYRIAGVVVDSQTGAPMGHVHMAISPDPRPQPTSVFTTSQGAFAFDVPAGKYMLRADQRGIRQSFDERVPGAGTGIVTGPKVDTSHLEFRWFAPGAISGKVTDEKGEPVEAALIQLIRSWVIAGVRRVSTAGWTWTNDRGEYRFGLRPAGLYYLAVTGKPWYSGARSFLGGPTETSEAFRPVYYPNAADPAGASLMKLTPGMEARADFSMVSTAGVTVTVKSTVPDNSSNLVSLTMDGIQGARGFQVQQRFYGGTVSLPGVPPGHYLVQVTGSDPTGPSLARKEIDVGAVNLNVELTAQRPPTVSGAIQWKHAGMKPRGTVLVGLLEEESMRTMVAAVGADGSFSFPAATTGKWRPMLRSADGYFISELHAEGAPLRDGVMDVMEGATVTLRAVASDETGHVSGFSTRDDQPASGMMVLLIPANRAAGTTESPGYQSDGDGSFDFTNVPAGDYLLFAVEDAQLEYKNPKVVAPYLAHATKVHVEPHQSYEYRVAVIPAQGN